ncbi:beta-galactosidase [Nonomuraea sp. NPDC050451]|uniref:beta-galactosidase n=1 Tax=Nonomuraea sp. NPDC050451 TaxID=3364364 RepID=UPI00378ABEE1
MLFGASYYHEYQPVERLEKDLDLMVAAGFTVIRVGESTWASYEPRDGEIGFAALSRVVDEAHQRGLKVIVGTPTYAIPPWLARQHPEVMAQPHPGRPLPYGARQNVDFTHPAFLFHAERILRRMGEEFGRHPGVIGFQVDNEIGVHQIANPHVVQRFREHVTEALGGVDGVNEKWGLTYWSHRISQPADIWPPDGNTNPGYALAWDRFQAALTVEFLAWQQALLREYVGADRFVTHDLIGGDGGRNTDLRATAQQMDVTAVNIYLPLQGALRLPEPPAEEMAGLGPDWSRDYGAWVASWKADLAYSMRGPTGSRFLVTEAQATSIGGSATNIPPFPGQLRLLAHAFAAHAFAARGADLLAYWHWHTLHYGFETYWGGVLGHDLEPGRVYAEVAALGEELKRLAPELKDATPDADVAILYSRDSLKAMEFMPALVKPGTSEPDPESYHRIVTRFYRSAADDCVQVRFVHADSDWSHQRVLVVPALYIADDTLLERLIEHARDGAHVLLTFRSGYADEHARVRWQRQPGVLRAAVGASYQEYSTVPSPVPLRARPVAGVPELALPESATATGWADGLQPEGADVLCEYEDPFLGRFAAVTTQAYGRGRVTWVGTLLDRPSTTALVRWALAERGQQPAADSWSPRPPSVRVSSATRPDGSRLWFVANHSWEPAAVENGGTLQLGPWESRVIVKETA